MEENEVDYDKAFARMHEALSTDMTLEPPLMPPWWGGGFVGDYKWWKQDRYTPHWSYAAYHANQSDIWYLNQDGKPHRLFGPAYISTLYDIEIWYKDGEYHRDGGPALRHKGTFWWFKEGKPHNLFGPAHVSGGRPPEYWIDGVKMSRKEHKKQVQSRYRRGLIK